MCRLELVQDQDDAVGVHEERALDLMLADPRVVADEAQRHVGLEAHPEQLLACAAVQRLVDLGQQRHETAVMPLPAVFFHVHRFYHRVLMFPLSK